MRLIDADAITNDLMKQYDIQVEKNEVKRMISEMPTIRQTQVINVSKGATLNIN